MYKRQHNRSYHCRHGHKHAGGGCKHNCCLLYTSLASKIPQEIAQYLDLPPVAVIPIPSKDGVLGIGDRELHSAVERAVGADILRSPDGD